MTAITSLALVAGVQGHVTVADANNGDAPLPDADITWSIFDPAPTGLAFTGDPAGGFFVNASSSGSATAQATYKLGAVTIPGPTLPVTVTAAIALEYLSP